MLILYQHIQESVVIIPVHIIVSEHNGGFYVRFFLPSLNIHMLNLSHTLANYLEISYTNY